MSSQVLNYFTNVQGTLSDELQILACKTILKTLGDSKESLFNTPLFSFRSYYGQHLAHTNQYDEAITILKPICDYSSPKATQERHDFETNQVVESEEYNIPPFLALCKSLIFGRIFKEISADTPVISPQNPDFVLALSLIRQIMPQKNNIKEAECKYDFLV